MIKYVALLALCGGDVGAVLRESPFVVMQCPGSQPKMVSRAGSVTQEVSTNFEECLTKQKLFSMKSDQE